MEFEDLIEVDASELFLGDEHLKIDTPEKKEQPESGGKKQTDINPEDSDEIDVDDYLDTLDTDSDDDEEEQDEDPKNKKKEVKEPKKETSEEPEDEEGSEPNVPSNEFAVFANILAEKGFFPDITDDQLEIIESEDDLADKLADQLNATFNKWQDVYKKDLVKNLIKEGYIAKEAVSDRSSLMYSEEDIKGNIDVAKEVIKKYYKRTGVPDKEIQRIIDSREDLEESALELNRLNEEMDKKEQQEIVNRMKQQEEITQRQKQEFTEKLKVNTFAYDEFIPGRKLKPSDKEEVFNNIEPTLQKINGDLSKYAPLLAYLDKYGLLDGKFDKIIKEGRSQGVSALQQILSEKKRGSGVGSLRKTGAIKIDDTGLPTIYK